MFLFLFLSLVALWYLNENPLRHRTLFVLGYPLLLTPLLLTYSSVMIKPIRTFQRTFLDEAFIRNAKSFCQTLLTPTFSLSFIVGDRSHCVTSQSHVLSCLSRSFTPTCTRLIVQYLSSLHALEVRTFLSHRSLLRMCFEFLG